MSIENRYPCPCCGYKTLNLAPPGTYLICPICFWEDDGDTSTAWGYSWVGSNQVTLPQAQRNFLAMGACEPQWLGDVRAPTPEEERDPNWQTIDALAEQTRLELIEKIIVVFKDVTLENGVSLHEARALDDYQEPVQARQMDGEVPWQEIPDSWIEEFSDVFAFMDAKGFRHAIPAYMIWCLKYSRQATNSFASTVDTLKSYYYRNRFFSGLTPDQQHVIAEFLEFVNTFIWPD